MRIYYNNMTSPSQLFVGLQGVETLKSKHFSFISVYFTCNTLQCLQNIQQYLMSIMRTTDENTGTNETKHTQLSKRIPLNTTLRDVTILYVMQTFYMTH